MKINTFLTVALMELVGNVYGATVSLSPSRAEVNVGDRFEVDIVGSGFDVVLDGGGFNVHFDPSVLQLDGVTIDANVWDPAFSYINGGIDNDTGDVTGLIFGSFTDNTGNFPIATLEFTAAALGSNSPLLLSLYDMNPFGSGGVDITNTVVLGNGVVDVSAVPLPAAGWLMMAGLGLLMSRRRSAVNS
jgi:hypothetical protein